MRTLRVTGALAGVVGASPHAPEGGVPIPSQDKVMGDEPSLLPAQEGSGEKLPGIAQFPSPQVPEEPGAAGGDFRDPPGSPRHPILQMGN